jgi:type IV pilus assembly protein PilA
MSKPKGFSLIELLIVVAIILIIAAIAIPNLLRSRIAANDASAVGSIRVIASAEIAYSNTYGTGFATLLTLGGAAPCTASAATACLIDPILSVAPHTKSGYVVAAVPNNGAGTAGNPYLQYEANATPTSLLNGSRAFCTDHSAVIHYVLNTTVAIGTGAGTCATIANTLQ